MMLQVHFRGILFKFEPYQLVDQYVIVQNLVGNGIWTHLDAAYAYRALREAVYGVIDQRTYHVRVKAERRGTAVTQIVEVIVTDKEAALMEACRQVAVMYPTWKISATLVSYECYRKFLSICKFHAGQEVSQ